MIRHIVITGGAGFVAIHTAEAALARGLAVTLIDLRAPPEDLRHLVPGATVRLGDIGAPGCLDGLAGPETAIIHCAAVVGPVPAKAAPLRTIEVNVMGTARLLEQVRAAGGRFILVSTATLYGHRADLAPLSETEPPSPLGMYDGSKQMAEILCTQYRGSYGMDIAAVRTGFVYGMGSRIGEYFIPRVLAGEAVHETAGGDHPCDFTYVVDLAEGLVAAATAPQKLPEPIYNITGGVLLTRGDFAAAVRAALPQVRISQAPGIDPARHLRGPCLIARAARDFGYRPRFTLAAGVADWIARTRPA